MIDQNTKLKIVHDDNGTFNDYSNDAADFAKDTFTIALDSATSYLYIGYYKPISSIYFELNTANTAANSFTAEYFNGSTWAELSNFNDDTKGLTRSGAMTWARNQNGQAANSVNSATQFWVRIKPSETHSTTVVKGIGFVFCDDTDLSYEVPDIVSALSLQGKSSHILTHVAVKNQIVQMLNNKDLKKRNPVTGLKEDLTCWDILNANQLKMAATYLALSKIYFNFSDGADDSYFRKSQFYHSKFKEAFEVSLLSLDTDDDGIEDNEEKAAGGLNIIRMSR